MNYYINPSWFYWLKVVSGIQDACIIISILFGILMVCLGVVYVIEITSAYDEEDFSVLLRFLKVSIVVFVVALLGSILTPNRETLIEMQIARYATRENVNTTVESIKSVVDYIVESINSMK